MRHSSRSRERRRRPWIPCSDGHWRRRTELWKRVRSNPHSGLARQDTAEVNHQLTTRYIAGMPAESLKGSRTAVFSASMLEDYSRMVAMDPENAERTAVTGSSVACIIPNRISWFFDLRGPSVHVNTACSGSLTAVDMACKTLESGDASCVSFPFYSDSLALILPLCSLPLSQYLTAKGYRYRIQPAHRSDHFPNAVEPGLSLPRQPLL